MDGSASIENLILCYSFGMGVFITLVYDLLRILRRVIKHNTFFVSLEDLLFWIFCALSVFALMYRMGNGNLRWFSVLGALIGMSAYLKFISPRLIRIVTCFLQKVTAVLVLPFRYLKNKLTAIYKLLKIKLCKQQ